VMCERVGAVHSAHEVMWTGRFACASWCETENELSLVALSLEYLRCLFHGVDRSGGKPQPREAAQSGRLCTQCTCTSIQVILATWCSSHLAQLRCCQGELLSCAMLGRRVFLSDRHNIRHHLSAAATRRNNVHTAIGVLIMGVGRRTRICSP
jgi:hypothetical protein